MEQWQNIICIYFGIEILLCIYTLFKYNKLQKLCKKNNDYAPLKKDLFRFFVIFFLILAALVTHLGYLMGSISFVWPPLVVIGLTLTIIISALISNKRHSK